MCVFLVSWDGKYIYTVFRMTQWTQWWSFSVFYEGFFSIFVYEHAMISFWSDLYIMFNGHCFLFLLFFFKISRFASHAQERDIILYENMADSEMLRTFWFHFFFLTLNSNDTPQNVKIALQVLNRWPPIT